MLYPAAVRLGILAPMLLLCLVVACGAPPDAPRVAESGRTAAAAQAPVEAVPAKSVPAESEPEANPRRRGRPLPAFSGWTLDDERLEISSLIGKRLVVTFFNPEMENALAVTRALNAIAPLRGKHNFEIVGIATGAERKVTLAFARRERIAFPVVDDSSARLARRFGLRVPSGMLGVDTEGYVIFGYSEFPGRDAEAIETNLRAALRLPALGSGGPSRPEAPAFTAPVLDSDEPFDTAAHRGEPLVLVFFLHTCPHCHAALRFLETTLAELPEQQRPRLAAIEIGGQTHVVRQRMRSEGLDSFPVLFDEDGSIQSDYGVFGEVPEIFLIDAEGRIHSRVRGWSAQREEPLMRMRLAQIAGIEPPLLLRKQGYSGNEVCGVCHELEYETWTFTVHASAFDNLVKHGVESIPECVPCHVVGSGEPGGFQNALETPELEGVGCETCHGRGGPHLSKEFEKMQDYSSVCLGCHDPQHSLGFEYATFLTRISHADNAGLVELPPEEKQRLLAERGRAGGALLPTNMDYVGSAACKSCHEPEFATWAASPHARAVETLASKGEAGNADCLPCHTTGFERAGGFPGGASVEAQPDLARVGCESCHGPGGEHVKEDAARFGDILSLGDKCDSCVILQICGSCHDDERDPGFDFAGVTSKA
jgi:peroxiredoxin